MSEPSPPIPYSTLEYYAPLPRPVGRPLQQRYWLHGLLLLATILTTLIVGARMQFNFLHNLPPFAAGDEFLPFFPIRWALSEPGRLLLGIPFSATLLGILLAHEMGHYLACRYYGVHATLPFFIPAPTFFGTFGAVIRIKSPIRSRAALFDIGIAGPIAGFVVAMLALAEALNFSKPLSPGLGPVDLRLGFPPVFYLIHHWLGRVVSGYAIARLPLTRVYMHPMAVAAWVGMYATALNLLPSSQLDGGHIVYALSPRVHRLISVLTVVGLVLLGRLSSALSGDHFGGSGWWMWAGLIAVMNFLTWRQRQAPDFPPLRAGRWTLAVFAAIMLALTITITPVQIIAR
jgi:membrane-associated protease RseP (regulator of RpoE activity)